MPGEKGLHHRGRGTTRMHAGKYNGAKVSMLRGTGSISGVGVKSDIPANGPLGRVRRPFGH
eukprot:6543523-Prorocentrum_lima.AAC.1